MPRSHHTLSDHHAVTPTIRESIHRKRDSPLIHFLERWMTFALMQACHRPLQCFVVDLKYGTGQRRTSFKFNGEEIMILAIIFDSPDAGNREHHFLPNRRAYLHNDPALDVSTVLMGHLVPTDPWAASSEAETTAPGLPHIQPRARPSKYKLECTAQVGIP